MTAIPNSRPTLSSLEWQRFERIGAWIVLLGVFTTLFGLSWDVDWHAKVGPDTFWTLPHLFVYSGAAITGFAALTTVLLCTFSPRQAGWISIIGGRFHAPLGFIVAGFGAFGFLSFGIFDQWWHTVFGFDVNFISPPHLGLFMSDILSMVGCALIFARGQRTHIIGVSVATAIAVAFTLPFVMAIFGDFGLTIPLLGLQAVLIPLALLFVVSSSRQPLAALLTAVMMVAFRWLTELVFPMMTVGYADSLGFSLRDGSNTVPLLPVLIPMLSLAAGLAVTGLMSFWKARKLPMIWGVLLNGLIAAPTLYLDSSLIPMQGGGAVLLIPVALVGALSAWLGWQLGVVARQANPELTAQAAQ
jgi:hypothetical protein